MHDAWRVDPRGKGTFDKVLNAARLLQRHQVEFNILTEIFDEWVARDVGSMFVINFDFSLANWLGTPTACIFAPECGTPPRWNATATCIPAITTSIPRTCSATS